MAYQDLTPKQQAKAIELWTNHVKFEIARNLTVNIKPLADFTEEAKSDV